LTITRNPNGTVNVVTPDRTDTLSGIQYVEDSTGAESYVGPEFAVTDTTTGVATQTDGTAYTGPVAGIQFQYIYTGSDNLNVTAAVANTFIHTGSGEDAIDVSHVGGTNVLDGGTNSNCFVGGTGPNSFDTFFVDDRSPSADIWSTVANFHAGDAVTIFGITPNGFATNWVVWTRRARVCRVDIACNSARRPNCVHNAQRIHDRRSDKRRFDD
jgi:hypothetical protein